MEKEIELYVHIPFCVKKCAYCDFLSAPADLETIKVYMRSLQAEIRMQSMHMRNKGVSTIFFGGGTPSVVPAEYIFDVMDTISHYFSISKDAEITLEANPGTIAKDSLSIYRQSGINRISMGLQSTNNEELKQLGRIHTFEQFLESYDLIRKNGFENVNVDLMSGLPGQEIVSWKKSLQQVCALKPEHISAYGLIIEEGTPFYDLYEEDEVSRENGSNPKWLPTEETERAMYMLTGELLEQHGYHRYEISNYARNGYECRHNIGYWRRVPYLGFGLGASSLIDEQRFSNESNLKTYLEKIGQGHSTVVEKSELSKKEQMEEFMFLGLRMKNGVAREDFNEAFSMEIEGVYGDVLPKLYANGLLIQSEGRIFLSEEGTDVSNYVMSEFLKD